MQADREARRRETERVSAPKGHNAENERPFFNRLAHVLVVVILAYSDYFDNTHFSFQQVKKERQEEHKANVAAGNPGDVDFIGMVRKWRAVHATNPSSYDPAFGGKSRLCVCVRKRPFNDKEREKYDHDAITCVNPSVFVHAAKTKVDGISKYLYVVSLHCACHLHTNKSLTRANVALSFRIEIIRLFVLTKPMGKMLQQRTFTHTRPFPCCSIVSPEKGLGRRCFATDRQEVVRKKHVVFLNALHSALS